MSDTHLHQNKAIYMKDKSDLALTQCYQRCNRTNDYKSPANREITCVQYCSIKFINAYSYAFDIIQAGGVARAPESQLKVRVLQ